MKRMFFGDTRINSWKEAGLLYESLVTGIIRTIKHNMILQRLGALLQQDFKDIQKNNRLIDIIQVVRHEVGIEFLKMKNCFFVLLAVLLTSFILPFAYPDFNYYWLSWIALVPLILIFNFVSVKASFFYGWIFGILFFMQNLIWLYLFGWPSGIAGSLYYGLFMAFFSFIVCWFYKKLHPDDFWFRLFLVPSAWVLVEFLKSLGPLGNPWGDISSSQYKFLSVLQILPWVGGYGLSWLIVLFNTFLAEVLYQCFILKRSVFKLRKFKYYVVFVSFLVVLVLIFGKLQLNNFKMRLVSHLSWKQGFKQREGASIKVALVQPNIDQVIKWDQQSYYEQLEILDKLTFLAEKYNPQLVVWPETSVLEFLRYSKGLCYKFSQMAKYGNYYLLIGAPDIDKDEKRYNSAFLFSPNLGLDKVYGKKHLVPFGEYVLLDKWLGNFKIFDRVGDYSSGKETTIFDCNFGKFFTLICFESTFPYLARAGTTLGANFLVVVTNDSWFERTHAAENHLALTVLRSVENRIYTLLCANTGISAIIEPTGKLQNYSKLYERTVVTGLIKAQDKKSFYCKFGPIILLISFLVIVIVLVKVGLSCHKY